MRTYTTHIKPGRPPILLREGWSWGALFFGPLWLLAGRAWIAAVLLVLLYALNATFTPHPLREAVVAILVVGTAIVGRDLRRWALARRGFALAHVVAAPDADAALLRFYAAGPDRVERPA